MVVEPLPKKIAAPLEFYNGCDDCEDFPEERYESVLKVAAEKEKKEQEIRKKVGLQVENKNNQIFERFSAFETSEIAKRSLNGVSGAADALTSSIGNDTATTVRSKGLSLTVAKKAANESNEASTLDGDPSGSSIAMPAFGDILSSTDGLGQIATKLVVSNSNPFQSTASKSGVQGSIVTLTLSNDNGQEIAVNGTKKPFIISIPNASPVGVVSSAVKLLEFRYHKVKIRLQGSQSGTVLGY